jgi:hypothetical protein
MQRPYNERLGNRIDPESCAGDREAVGDALAGTNAGPPKDKDQVRRLEDNGRTIKAEGLRHGESGEDSGASLPRLSTRRWVITHDAAESESPSTDYGR